MITNYYFNWRLRLNKANNIKSRGYRYGRHDYAHPCGEYPQNPAYLISRFWWVFSKYQYGRKQVHHNGVYFANPNKSFFLIVIEHLFLRYSRLNFIAELIEILAYGIERKALWRLCFLYSYSNMHIKLYLIFAGINFLCFSIFYISFLKLIS